MNIDAFVHYKLNIPSIDQEHLDLILLMNKIIYDEDQCTGENDPCKKIVDEIDFKIREHFVNEEALMTKISFSYLDYHKKAHKLMLVELNKLTNANCKNLSYYSHLVHNLQNIIVHHIDQYDGQIGMFIRDNNIEVNYEYA